MIDILHDLLPASKSCVTGIETVTADNILKSLDDQGIEYKFTRLSSGDWEVESSESTDNEILEMLNMPTAGHAGEILICTEACSRYDYAPFSCDATQLGQFINDYDFEMFFDGDVVMVCEKTGTMTVFHHAGGFAHVKF